MSTSSRRVYGPLGALAWILASTAVAAQPSESTAAPGAPASVTTPALSVRESVICTSVDRATRSAVRAGSSFPATVGQLACFTRIDGGIPGTTIVHVWKQGATERARVSLPIGGPGWRTWSTKRIPAAWTGDWSVEVQDAAGRVIQRIPFRVDAAATTPQMAPAPATPTDSAPPESEPDEIPE